MGNIGILKDLINTTRYYAKMTIQERINEKYYAERFFLNAFGDNTKLPKRDRA
jgi:hypothetical protein